jgi:hypothetical protein
MGKSADSAYVLNTRQCYTPQTVSPWQEIFNTLLINTGCEQNHNSPAFFNFGSIR